MKKLLIFMLVFGMASLANATLLISVDGVTDPVEEIILGPSDEVTIDIMGDGRDQPQDAFLIIQGLGAIAGYTMLYPGSASLYMELEEFAEGAGMTPEDLLAALGTAYGYHGATDLSYMNFADTTPMGGPYDPLSGKLVDDIIFHCEGGIGDVTLTLTDGEFAQVFDTQIIHQIPEPATIALLGLGGLFLRRRRKKN